LILKKKSDLIGKITLEIVEDSIDCEVDRVDIVVLLPNRVYIPTELLRDFELIKVVVVVGDDGDGANSVMVVDGGAVAAVELFVVVVVLVVLVVGSGPSLSQAENATAVHSVVVAEQSFFSPHIHHLHRTSSAHALQAPCLARHSNSGDSAVV
jgi:hypothetical protein